MSVGPSLHQKIMSSGLEILSLFAQAYFQPLAQTGETLLSLTAMRTDHPSREVKVIKWCKIHRHTSKANYDSKVMIQFPDTFHSPIHFQTEQRRKIVAKGLHVFPSTKVHYTFTHVTRELLHLSWKQCSEICRDFLFCQSKSKYKNNLARICLQKWGSTVVLGLVLFPQSKKVVGLNPLTSLCLGGFSLFFLQILFFRLCIAFLQLIWSFQCNAFKKSALY